MEKTEREKVSIVFLSEPNFDANACKFLVLHLNKLQDCFEFEFPEVEEYPIKKGDYNETYLLTELDKVMRAKGLGSEYYIGIVTSVIGQNLFWFAGGKMAVITTEEWQKHFAPPSVFEYLIHAITSSLIQMSDKTGTMTSHHETRGCCLDYTYFKEDDRIDIASGYTCDSCKLEIREKIGDRYLRCFERINSFEWLGEVTERGTAASDLKKYFKIDLDKDTGFYKTYWEKAKEHFPELPKDLVFAVLNAIIAALVALLVTAFAK